MFQGGRHIDYVVDQIVAKLIEVVKKKNKAGVSVKPFQVVLIMCCILNWSQCGGRVEKWLTFHSCVPQVKNHIWVFVNALIENPSFDSQTKENMTLQTKSFGSKCLLSEKFIRAVRTLLFDLFSHHSVFCLFLWNTWCEQRKEFVTMFPTGNQLWDRGEHTQLGEVQSPDAAE